jgi:hypothetical protein
LAEGSFSSQAVSEDEAFSFPSSACSWAVSEDSFPSSAWSSFLFYNKKSNVMQESL